MRKLLALLFCIGCAATRPSLAPPPSNTVQPLPALARQVGRATVALVLMDDSPTISCDESGCEIGPSDPHPFVFCSGSIIEPALVLTAAHCVEGAEAHTGGDNFWVEDYRGNQASTTVLAMDSRNDLALVALNHDLNAGLMPLGEEPLAGDFAMVVGHPLGLRFSATFGHVSAVRPAGDPDDDFTFEWVQTDAPINPGNSGGPLVDRLGRLIGVCDFTFRGMDGLHGAVSINEIRHFVAVYRPVIDLYRTH